MFNFHKLINSQYLFTIPVVLVRSDWLFLYIGAIAIVLSIVFKIAAKTSPSPVDHKYRQKFYSLLLFTGVWEVVWFGCRWENVNLFGTHFVALFGVLIALVWLLMIIISMVKNYTSQKQAWEKEQVRLKYLPH